MSSLIRYNNLYFLTATIHLWKSLLKTEQNKEIMVNTFSFMVNEKRMNIYAFVILENHLHLLFESLPPYNKSSILNSIFSFSSKQIMTNLTANELELFRVERSNKQYQIWKPNPLCVEIISQKFLKQKMNYIHKNVERAGLDAESYEFSSWPSYLDGKSKFDFLTLWG